MSKKDRPEAVGHAVGTIIGIVIEYLIAGWMVMWAFSALHHDAPGVPALGWSASFLSAIAVIVLVNVSVGLSRRA